MDDKLNELQANIIKGEENEPEEVTVDVSEDDSLQRFFDEVENVRKDINQIKINTREIQDLHEQALDSSNTSGIKELNEQIETKTKQTNEIGNNAKERIKAIRQDTEERSKTKEGIGETRIRESQQNQLTQDLQNALESFGNMQAENRKRYRQRMERQVRIVRPNVTPDEIDDILEHGTDQIFKEQILSSSHANAKMAYLEVVEKHRDLLMIEQSLQELYEMFQDLAFLVEQQEELIDNVATNVAKSVDYMQSANQELKKARSYQKKSRKKLFLLIIIVTIAIAVAIALLVGVPTILGVTLSA
eukprot:gb/GECH01004271.1/.p1 GENE.gb/GECH01004271.1/~~gb/GECH01004271.1/.p1  ORF type:complete len:303 (+),score=86.05 gb/GECH01004271.1/:1-909(+)